MGVSPRLSGLCFTLSCPGSAQWGKTGSFSPAWYSVHNAAPNFSPYHTDPAATKVPALWLLPLSLPPPPPSTSLVRVHFPVSSTLSPRWMKNTQSESMMKITIPNESQQHKATQGPPNCPCFRLPSLPHICAVQSLAFSNCTSIDYLWLQSCQKVLY